VPATDVVRRVPATDVVQLYRSSLRIKNMCIYALNAHAVHALRGSGVRLILGVANEDIASLATGEPTTASSVQVNVKSYHPAVRITYITVGNEVGGEAAALRIASSLPCGT
jgi:hypothetical protein